MDAQIRRALKKAILENDKRLVASVVRADAFDPFYQLIFEDNYQLTPATAPEQFCDPELFRAVLAADTETNRALSQAIRNHVNDLALGMIDSRPEMLKAEATAAAL